MIRPMRTLLACILASILSSACVNIPKELSELQPTRSSGTLTLSEAWPVTKTLYLSRGTYVAESENSFGVLFRAKGYPVVVAVRENQVFAYPGGIWLPKTEGQPRIFLVMGDGRIYPTLDSALASGSPPSVPGVDTNSVNAAILAMPGTQVGTPLQAGVAAGASMALVGAIADSIANEERGKSQFVVPLDRVTLRERVAPSERDILR